jgi:hypothetical protein
MNHLAATLSFVVLAAGLPVSGEEDPAKEARDGVF